MKKLMLSILSLCFSAAGFGFELPPLPYPVDALEPVMSAETLEYHHGKHLKAYVDNLNALIEGTIYADSPLDVIVRDSRGAIFNNAGQIANHILFFGGLNSESKAKHAPAGDLAQAINETFGSFEAFRDMFKQLAVSQFGSGWAWLVLDKSGILQIMQTSNADTPEKNGYIVLLACDVWEHSYYIDYRNRRADYIDNLWRITDWSVMEKRYAEGKEKVL